MVTLCVGCIQLTGKKMGLLHAHILVWLKKIRPTQIDEVISAELPNEEDDRLLFKIICKNMIHGPCETQTGNDGYPLYRSRKPGQERHTASIKTKLDSQYKQVEVDNRWVVPYTPLLSKMFEAHITAEYCNSKMDRVYFTAENARERATQPPNSTLTAFFLMCQEDPFTRTLLYPEVPKYYTWNKSSILFCKRKQGVRTPGCDTCASEVLGQVYTVHPNNSECYYLKLLLHTVHGPTSFAALRTFDGEVFQTYRETCQKPTKSIYNHNNHLHAIQSSCSLEEVEKYKESLSEDILREQRRANPTLDFDFTSEIFNETLILLEDKCILMERCYDGEKLKAFVAINKPLLTSEQKEAYDTIFDLISCERGGIFFLDAPGGTGKTFLINLLLAEIRRNNKIANAVASSGIASSLLDSGRTAHSTLQLPINLAQTETPIFCKALVWDECTMMHKKGLEALDRTMKDLSGNNWIMGGAVVVLAGDFHQTLPVIP
ncbi:hypothetical protein J437_LFUL015378 [Ladona fulva]|uniref:ATP-dependent DNA helicase n=1 Tax=Ladona fulva TaxID=123851 RepID=A0A8K0KIQ4_LADFU|nr:hypothetical protein J437_LFUL015378 [Ladona fulva]